VPAAALSGIVAISAGSGTVQTLNRTGGVLCFGYNGEGQLNVPVEAQSGIVAVSSGSWHQLALTAAGRVIGWCVCGPGLDGARR
jgi:alpha-tubulin suppressor-like RCC1 family protein